MMPASRSVDTLGLIIRVKGLATPGCSLASLGRGSAWLGNSQRERETHLSPAGLRC